MPKNPERTAGPKSPALPESATTPEEFHLSWLETYISRLEELITRHHEVMEGHKERLAILRSRRRKKRGEISDLAELIKLDIEYNLEFNGERDRLVELYQAGYSEQNMRILLALLGDVIETLADFRVSDPH